MPGNSIAHFTKVDGRDGAGAAPDRIGEDAAHQVKTRCR
jgi:hypothetical protein